MRLELTQLHEDNAKSEECQTNCKLKKDIVLSVEGADDPSHNNAGKENVKQEILHFVIIVSHKSINAKVD